jgi:hypothetical protein
MIVLQKGASKKLRRIYPQILRKPAAISDISGTGSRDVFLLIALEPS